MTAGPCDPGILGFLAETAALHPGNAVDFTMAEQRALYDALCGHFHKPRPADVTVCDSAGGGLAAAIALDARDRGLPAPRGLVLVYPGLGGDRSRGSCVERAQAPGLATRDVAWYAETWPGGVKPDAAMRKFATPLAKTEWRGLPPAFLVACERDPLRDDCFDLAMALTASLVPARVRLEPQLVHAFPRTSQKSEPAAASFAAIVEAVAALAYSGRLPH